MSLKPTFQNNRDRLTYLLAEGQFLIAGLLVASGAALWWFDPKVPTVPPAVVELLEGALILSPPLFLLGIYFAKWVRARRYVDVYRINAVEDAVEHWKVPPELWAEKTVEGPEPYPINGKTAWGVREFDYHEEADELVVRGVWLSACEDTELLTSKSHMEDIYDSLIESHLKLGRLRSRISKMGVEIQERVVTEQAEQHERGVMIDKSAVKDAYQEAASDADEWDDEDLPTLEAEDLPDGDLAPDPRPESEGDAAGGDVGGEL